MDKILDVKTESHKYKVGDYVRIKDIDNLTPSVSSGMRNYAGTEACITSVEYDDVEEIYVYKLDIDSGIHFWTEEMFTFMWAKKAYIKGDFVKVRTDLEVGKPYGNLSFCDGMQYYAGYPTIVNEVTEQGNYILADCEDWRFSAEMLEISSWYEFAHRSEFAVLATKDDPVNHPSHYTDGKIEVIDFILDKKLNFCLGNACKYISRAGKKDSTKTIEDLKKAVWYINKEIEKLRNKQ